MLIKVCSMTFSEAMQMTIPEAQEWLETEFALEKVIKG